MQKIGNEITKLSKINAIPHCDFEAGIYDWKLEDYPNRAYSILRMSKNSINTLHNYDLSKKNPHPMFAILNIMHGSEFFPYDVDMALQRNDTRGLQRRLDILRFFRANLFKLRPPQEQMAKRHPWNPGAGSMIYIHEWELNLFSCGWIREALKKAEAGDSGLGGRIRSDLGYDLGIEPQPIMEDIAI